MLTRLDRLRGPREEPSLCLPSFRCSLATLLFLDVYSYNLCLAPHGLLPHVRAKFPLPNRKLVPGLRFVLIQCDLT